MTIPSPTRSGRAAFTLIELLAVITIILLLAGMVVGSMGFVTDRQAKEKARVQIGLLSQALEKYKLENGSYPLTDDSTDGLGNTSTLFKALYLDGVNDPNKSIYLPELNPEANKQGWTAGAASDSTKITDPWGNEYRYRTAINSGAAPNNTNLSTQNPDFDLWTAGKDAQTKPETPNDKINRDDIKNF